MPGYQTTQQQFTTMMGPEGFLKTLPYGSSDIQSLLEQGYKTVFEPPQPQSSPFNSMMGQQQTPFLMANTPWGQIGRLPWFNFMGGIGEDTGGMPRGLSGGTGSILRR